MIGVSYYDFRNNTADRTTLPTDYWIALSIDALNFRESHLSGPFDLNTAPEAGGLFLGDYQALTSDGTDFLPFFVQTDSDDLTNRTDVFIGFGRMLPTAQARPSTESVALVAPPVHVTPEWRRRMQAGVLLRLEQRMPGWAERRGTQ